MTLLSSKQKSIVNVLGIFAIATVALHALTLLILLFQGFIIRNLSTQKPPNFIQLIDGKIALENENQEPDPEEIRQFVSQTMGAIFNWTGALPAETIEDATNPKPDAGISIKTPQGTIKRVPTSSWIGSFALAEDFREGFLGQIAQIVPPEVFSQNPNQALAARLVIQRVYPAQKIAANRWRVGMVANIVQLRRSDNKKILTPFNKDFLVRSIDSFDHPLANQITQLQKSVYSVRAQKLEIYEISNLCLYDISSNSRASRCGDTNSDAFVR